MKGDNTKPIINFRLFPLSLPFLFVLLTFPFSLIF